MELSRLIALSNRLLTERDRFSPKLPGLSILRREAESDIECVVYEPVLCLILQGSKTVSVGEQTVALKPGDALLVSHDLPVVSRITQASVWSPVKSWSENGPKAPPVVSSARSATD